MAKRRKARSNPIAKALRKIKPKRISSGKKYSRKEVKPLEEEG